MRRDSSTAIGGWPCLSGPVMFGWGWMLRRHHVGAFSKPENPPAINRHLRRWLRMRRVHLFGLVTTVTALAAGLAEGRLPTAWICGAAALLGLAASAVALALPKRLVSDTPVLHLQAIWLLVTGVAIIRRGIGIPEPRQSVP